MSEITKAAREAAEKIAQGFSRISFHTGNIAAIIQSAIDGAEIVFIDRLVTALIGIMTALTQQREADAKRIYRECAEYVLKLHLAQHPKTGAIDALKTAYDEFNTRARPTLQHDEPELKVDLCDYREIAGELGKALGRARYLLTTNQGAFATDIDPCDNERFWRIDDAPDLKIIDTALARWTEMMQQETKQ